MWESKCKAIWALRCRVQELVRQSGVRGVNYESWDGSAVGYYVLRSIMSLGY